VLALGLMVTWPAVTEKAATVRIEETAIGVRMAPQVGAG
jgi:hypothetical protein